MIAQSPRRWPFAALLASTILIAGAGPALAGAMMIPNLGQTDPAVAFYASGARASIFFTREAIVLDLHEPAGAALVREGRVDPLEAAALRKKGRAVYLWFEGGARADLRIEGRGARSETMSFLLGDDPASWHPNVTTFDEVVVRDLLPGTDVAFREEGGQILYRLEAHGSPGGPEAAAHLPLRVDGPAAVQVTERDGEGSIAWGAGPPAHRDDSSRLRWASYLGGSGDELAWGLTADSNGNPVVTGLTTSTFFPTTPGGYDISYNGFGDVFVTKLAADGSALLWSTFVGGSAGNFDYGYAVDLDSNGNPIVTGYTFSSNFPTTLGAYDRTHNGVTDVFVTKLDGATGGSLSWSTFVGGVDIDIAYSLAVDTQDRVAVCGRTLSFDFPNFVGAYDPSQNGEEDGFVMQLAADGSTLLWATFLGGTAFDAAQAIAIGPFGDLLLAGYTASADFPSEADEYAGGLYDAFAARLSGDGTTLQWSRLLGGTEYEFANGLALDESGNAVIAGATGSPDFPVSDGCYDDSYNGNEDAWVGKLDGATGARMWATYLGGSEPAYETIFGVAVDPSGQVIVGGSTPSPDFPTTSTGYDTSHNGWNDAFVARLDATGSDLLWSSFLGGGLNDYTWDAVLAADGDVLLSGSTESPDFPATAGAFDTSFNNGDGDSFVARMRAVALDPAAAPSPPRVAEARGVRIHPNPGNGGPISIDFPARWGGEWVNVSVHDARGREVASFGEHLLASGMQRLTWIPRDRQGRALAAGTYWIALEGNGERAEAPLTLVR